jgi:hypothetical protein
VKGKIFLAALVSSFFFSLTLNAQGQSSKRNPGQAEGAQVLVGPIAGGNFSWIAFGEKDYKDLYTVKPSFGYHFGGHLAFRVRKRFFLNTSVIYMTKGFTMVGMDDVAYTTEQDLSELKGNYKYIDMPIVYTAHFIGRLGKQKFKYSLGIGPNISYWLGGKGTIENTDTYEFSTGILDYHVVFGKIPGTATEHEMVVEKPNRIQLGLNFTAGLLFEPAPNRQLMVTLRYEMGHSYFSRESIGSFGPTFFEMPLNVRNQGFRISTAYLFDLKLEQRKKGKSTIKKNQR